MMHWSWRKLALLSLLFVVVGGGMIWIAWELEEAKKPVRTRVVVFDTSVADLSHLLDDPVEILFGTQLGGGTDINRALAYCRDLVERPQDTILVLISDLYEGGNKEQMVRRARALVDSGVRAVALLALSDSGAPGDTVVYNLVVHNTGDTADVFDLSFADVNGWTTGVTPAQVGLAPDGTAPVTVTVDIPAGAGDGPQIDWVGDWKEAFRLAKQAGKPVMVCINSKDGEQANERAAKNTYRDPWFVPMTRRFVMMVVSVREHAAEGVCPRFGKVTCEQHLACW